MINIRELRIGNYVNVRNTSGNKSVSGIVFSINDSLVSVKGNTNPYDYHLLEPIPLTEEILLNNKFEKIKNRITFRIVPRIAYELKYKPKGCNDVCFLVFIKDNGEFNHVVPADNDKECALIPVKSLHQLQNLYFSLTGEELEANL